MNTQLQTDQLTEWVHLYSDDLFRWAVQKTNKVDVAEDLIQETFISAHKAMTTFEGKSSPKTWLHAILRNKLMDYFRKQKRSYQSTTEEELNFFDVKKGTWNPENNPTTWHNVEENLLDNKDFTIALATCIEKLPDRWQQAIQSKYIQEKKADDICKELQITTSNYWQVIHRAKLNLRNCLENNWFKS
ncbi:sigma-70 family RNA polymerase sigma factor [Flammeovirga pectinis]|uniref:Sigma-70 family RNA polymerase sigma factor n=1 Tax=Flammeovirga pectinis TaxID=2494373 RepID=A0A3Q9FKC9_9BACT|nr:sigma-70 family RNA polymerase sigma factor [Flammeovirga pectinis]AZQ61710.1 sigma-70 family RNA polymerase sigma factor [Flammeovirga pectinis]